MGRRAQLQRRSQPLHRHALDVHRRPASTEISAVDTSQVTECTRCSPTRPASTEISAVGTPPRSQTGTRCSPTRPASTEISEPGCIGFGFHSANYTTPISTLMAKLPSRFSVVDLSQSGLTGSLQVPVPPLGTSKCGAHLLEQRHHHFLARDRGGGSPGEPLLPDAGLNLLRVRPVRLATWVALMPSQCDRGHRVGPEAGSTASWSRISARPRRKNSMRRSPT